MRAAVLRLGRHSHGDRHDLDGRLKLDELVSARMGLDASTRGSPVMKTGALARSVIVFE